MGGVDYLSSQTDRRTRGSDALNFSHLKSSHLMLFDDWASSPVYLHYGLSLDSQAASLRVCILTPNVLSVRNTVCPIQSSQRSMLASFLWRNLFLLKERRVQTTHWFCLIRRVIVSQQMIIVRHFSNELTKTNCTLVLDKSLLAIHEIMRCLKCSNGYHPLWNIMINCQTQLVTVIRWRLSSCLSGLVSLLCFLPVSWMDQPHQCM